MTDEKYTTASTQPDGGIKDSVDESWAEHGSGMAYDTYISLYSEGRPRIDEARMTAAALLADMSGTTWQQGLRQLTAFLDQFMELFGVPEEGMLREM